VSKAPAADRPARARADAIRMGMELLPP